MIGRDCVYAWAPQYIAPEGRFTREQSH